MPTRKKSDTAGVSSYEKALFRQSVDETLPSVTSESFATASIDGMPNREGTEDETPFRKNAVRGIIQDDGDFFYRSGVQKNTLRSLRRGRFRVKAEIDLHGCTRTEALGYLKTFIDRCEIQDIDCVRIVTGKGKSSPNHRSIIREAALLMLSQEPRVLAYSIAIPKDGGSGAFYVLLTP